MLFRSPFEAELAASTLWPETEKIFGHGYEVKTAFTVILGCASHATQSISLAVSSSRSMIATACKATTPEHAVVRVYDTEKWQLIGKPLSGHSLTVTRVAFNPDDRLILSVSRDRTWKLHELRENEGEHGAFGEARKALISM